jgi:pimeloyl-ACP methyl ester carboxylesterase
MNNGGHNLGPTVLLLHGFPECWYSWRHQMGALHTAGFHVVAIDLRGYGLSDAPERQEDYTCMHYVGDVVGLLDALSLHQVESPDSPPQLVMKIPKYC